MDAGSVTSQFDGQPVSRTYQYRKVMKPMLERKRRARINRYLDELKDLMIGVIPPDGDVTKLEKADILELTVRHLHELQRPSADPVAAAKTFQAGFGHCAAAACNFLRQIDSRASRQLIQHLENGALLSKPLTVQVPGPAYSPPISPTSPTFSRETNHTKREAFTPSYNDLSQPITGLLMEVPQKKHNVKQIHNKAMTGIKQLCFRKNNEMKKGHSDLYNGRQSGVEVNRKVMERKETMELIRNQILRRQRNMRKENLKNNEEIDVEHCENGSMWRPW